LASKIEVMGNFSEKASGSFGAELVTKCVEAKIRRMDLCAPHTLGPAKSTLLHRTKPRLVRVVCAGVPQFDHSTNKVKMILLKSKTIGRSGRCDSGTSSDDYVAK
jgi:hypothetical protein